MRILVTGGAGYVGGFPARHLLALGPDRAGLELGGSMKPQRIAGAGGLFIRTPKRDVACDTFNYDLRTSLAELSAAPGRTVSVLTRGTPRPFRAARVLWDLDADTITVLKGAAVGTP